MDIGTAKPDAATRARVRAPPDRHHRSRRGLFGRALPRRRARARSPASARAARVPLLVGGTMLYFKALAEGLSRAAGGRPGGARAPRCARRGGGLAGAACASSRASIRRPRRASSRPTRSGSSARSRCTRSTGTPLSQLQGARETGDARSGPTIAIALLPPDRARAARGDRRALRRDARGGARRRAARRCARASRCAPICRRCAASATGRRGSSSTARIDAATLRAKGDRRDAPAREAPAHVAARDAGDARSSRRRRASPTRSRRLLVRDAGCARRA